LNPLNLTELQEFLDFKKPYVVVNAIGKTGRPNIDWCEDNKEPTMKSNVIAAANLAMECAKRNIYFVHIGSGCIYSGYPDNGFKETDEPNFYGPQFYAKTKILSEGIISEFPSLIIRIRMPIDSEPHERNLIDKLRKYQKVLDAPNSMTSVPNMLETLKILIERRRTGIYNLVNPGLISAVEIMKMYKEIVDPYHTFEVFDVEGLDKVTKGKRSNTYLNTDKLKSEGIVLPDIRAAVKECLLKYKGSLVVLADNYKEYRR
jgi:dTDP-4-dehydrorhamnose reductase